MALDKADVAQIAALARIRLAEAELEPLAARFVLVRQQHCIELITRLSSGLMP